MCRLIVVHVLLVENRRAVNTQKQLKVIHYMKMMMMMIVSFHSFNTISLPVLCCLGACVFRFGIVPIDSFAFILNEREKKILSETKMKYFLHLAVYYYHNYTQRLRALFYCEREHPKQNITIILSLLSPEFVTHKFTTFGEATVQAITITDDSMLFWRRVVEAEKQKDL